MACGWSPLGSKSETSLKRMPPSDFSGRGGRCGVHGVASAQVRVAGFEQLLQRLAGGGRAQRHFIGSLGALALRLGRGEIQVAGRVEAELARELGVEARDGAGVEAGLRRLAEAAHQRGVQQSGEMVAERMKDGFGYALLAGARLPAPPPEALPDFAGVLAMAAIWGGEAAE